MIYGLFGVELVVCAWIMLLLAVDALLPPARRSALSFLAFVGIAAAAIALAFQGHWLSQQDVAGGMLPGWTAPWILNRFALWFKGLFLLTTAVVIVMTKSFAPRHLPSHIGAFYALLFTALLGACVLSSMNDLLMLFLGLELVTFSLYIMAAYLRTDRHSVEAGMKYLILGSISSGFLVYGIALLYGYAGSTSFPVLAQTLFAGADTIPLTAKAGLLLVIAGLGFKVAAAPFQLWLPDVYEGAPTPVVAFLAVGSKMAGIVALLRVLYGVFMPLQAMWMELLAVLSAATMLYGNLGAIPQTNIKRLLGYSSIGHAGYLLMGLSTGSLHGAEAVGFYLLAYLFSTLTVFLVVVIASDALGGDRLEHYHGLSKRSPLLAAAMFLGLLSLAGVPPLAGFAGKLLVLLRTVESQRLWLAGIGAVNVAISLYYYLLVVKRMYVDAPSSTAPIAVDGLTKATLAVLVLGLLAIGIYQEPFLQRVAAAFASP